MRNVNTITRAICERATREGTFIDENGYVTNTRRLAIIFALVVCINWRLMENVQDIERLLALGPNVIESSTITIRLITSWQNLSFVQSCDFVGGILLLALRNLDKHLIIISNND